MNRNALQLRSGVYPSQMLVEAIKAGWISSHIEPIPESSIQPASVDLRLGSVAYRLRCSFLPANESVSAKLARYQMGELDLTEGAILEQNRPYLIPLMEQLDLPDHVRAKANPKSSTGRLDVFTRVIADRSFTFDDVPQGYRGRLFVEVVPRTFTIRVRAGMTLNQLRLIQGHSTLTDEDIRNVHAETPLLYRAGRPLEPSEIDVSNGLFLGLYLGRPNGARRVRSSTSSSMKRTASAFVGYRAKENSNLIDLSKVGHYNPRSFWEQVYSEAHGRIVLHPEKFYLLMSEDAVRIPPRFAAEMTAYDPTSGELRTHYAGFFDPGFGWGSESGQRSGSRAALEVRAHDVPFAVEHGQNICKLSFEPMLEEPDRLYGDRLLSNYQDQTIALSKHFRKPRDGGAGQPALFDT